MKKSIICALIAIFACNISLSAQNTFAGHYTRSLHDIMETVAQRWGVRFKYNVDTTGLRLPYADFRVRPYSLEETLTNICKYFDFNWWKQNGNLYKIKPYEYPRRHVEEGAKMLAYLSTLYSDRQQHEARRDSVRREVRARLGIDSMMAKLVPCKPVLGKKVVCDGTEAVQSPPSLTTCNGFGAKKESSSGLQVPPPASMMGRPLSQGQPPSK